MYSTNENAVFFGVRSVKNTKELHFLLYILT